MNANELKDHLREWMRKPTDELKDHLTEMGVEVPAVVKSKQAMVKLHADHHGSAPLTGSDAVGRPAPAPAPAKRPAPKANAKPATKTAPKAPARKATAKPAAKAPAAPKPATRTRKAPAAPAAAKATPARRASAKATPKAPARKAPATKPASKAPAPAPAANGSAPANATKHDLAKRLIDMVAREFANETPENKAKLSYWLHGLPTGYPNGGGGGYLRYWPESLPKPTTAGWRPPAAK